MKGFYNQRSGVALGPPYTAFVQTGGLSGCPDSSAPITQSTYSILDGGDAQKDLAKGDTGRPVPGAWGGYHDAGDWNPRRVTHMRTTTFWQLELLDLFPAYFQQLRLTLPSSNCPPPQCPICSTSAFLNSAFSAACKRPKAASASASRPTATRSTAR